MVGRGGCISRIWINGAVCGNRRYKPTAQLIVTLITLALYGIHVY